MKPWEIWTYDFPGIGSHPAVLISGVERCAHKPLVELLRCGSARAGRQPSHGEVLLDTADGLNWETLCFCDLVWTAQKTELRQRRGTVTHSRQRAIIAVLLQSHSWVGI